MANDIFEPSALLKPGQHSYSEGGMSKLSCLLCQEVPQHLSSRGLAPLAQSFTGIPTWWWLSLGATDVQMIGKEKLPLSLVDSSSRGPGVFSSPLSVQPPWLSLMESPAAEEASRWTCSTSLPTCWVLSQYLPSVIDYFPVYRQHLYSSRERKKCPVKVASAHGLLSTYWSLQKCSSYGECRKKGVGQ